MKYRKIVEVEWEDSWSSHHWGTKDKHVDAGDAPGRIVSVGYLVSRDGGFLRMTSGFDGQDNPNLECLHSIPDSAVRKIRQVRK